MPNTNSEDSKSTDHDNPDSLLNRLSIKQIGHNFLEYTTAHGCGRLAASTSCIWSFFWVVVILGCHFAFYYHAYLLVGDYLERATRSKISMHSIKKLDFPVITICNRNMFRKSKVNPETLKRIRSVLNETTTAGISDKTLSLDTTKTYLTAKNKHPDKAKEETLRSIWRQTPKKTKIKMGHQLQDMLLDCSFSGQSCRNLNDSKTWGHIWLDDVGNCFQFNHARDQTGQKTQPHKQLFQGRPHGLKLILDIEQDEYIEGVTEVAGLKVYIGDHGEMPFPVYDGVSIGPGLSTDMKIKLKHVKRLDPFQNSSCKETKKTSATNIYNSYNISYTKRACDVSCFAHSIQTNCGCSLYEITANESMTLCNSSYPGKGECIDKMYLEFLEGSCDPVCPPPCFEVSFDSTVSTSKWPANSFKNFLVKKLEKDTSLPLTEENIEDNLVELRVYYANMDYIRVEEKLKYDFESLISDIGGQMGIWIGLSVLTMAELVELAWKLIHSITQKRGQRTLSIAQSKEKSAYS